MKVYLELVTGNDGKLYEVQYLLSPERLALLQAAGIIGYAGEAIGMQDCADAFVSVFEKQGSIWTRAKLWLKKNLLAAC